MLEFSSFAHPMSSQVNFHAMRGDMADEVEDVSEDVTVGHWGSSMPPVIHRGLNLHRSRSQPVRLAPPSSPVEWGPDPPPLYDEVMEGGTAARKPSNVSQLSEMPPPLYWELYPASPGLYPASPGLYPASPGLYPVSPASPAHCVSLTPEPGGSRSSITSLASPASRPRRLSQSVDKLDLLSNNQESREDKRGEK